MDIKCFYQVFKKKLYVEEKHNSIICERFGVPNIGHPLYKQGNYAKKNR